MPGYGQNTKIPTPRSAREAPPVPPTPTRNTRPTTAVRPGNPPPSSSTPRSRTYTKSKPNAAATRPGTQGGVGTSAAVENKDPNTSTAAGPPSKALGSYGQRYANKKANPSTAIPARPHTTADASRWKLALDPTLPAPVRPSKVQVPPVSRVEQKRPSTSVPRSKKTAVSTLPPAADINANSRLTVENKLEARAPSAVTRVKKRSKKASKSVSQTGKKVTRSRSKEGGSQNQQSSSDNSVSSDLDSNHSNVSDESRKPEAVSLAELPQLNLFDINLSRGFGTAVHIDSVPAQSTLSLDKLPEYTLKKEVCNAKYVEVLDGISIDEISPPPELHSVISDPKLQDYLTLNPVTPPPESIDDIKQPHLVASEESLHQAGAPVVELDTLSEFDSIPTESIPDASRANERLLQDFPLEDDKKNVPSVDETKPIGTAVIPAAEGEQPERMKFTEDLNCYEINPKEKYEYLGHLVRIPKGITLTKNVPPLYVGIFSIDNSSQEELIFKVKTRTQSANVYAINPKFGSLAGTSTKLVKVQADFSKGMSPSPDMLRNNMVVLVASAPPVKMTRKDMEKFWKLLQDQQDGGKSSFYVHTVEDIQLVDYDSPLLPETRIATKPAVVERKPSPLVIPVEIPREPNPLAMSPAVTDIVTYEPEEPSFDAVYADQSINEVTQDVRAMTGSMNSLLRWGCISVYATSVLGVMFLFYQNANEGVGVSDGNGGLLNWFSSWREKFPSEAKKHP